jgi:outer membrane protein OmpA-like peptidoglycan-associated protein
MKNVLLIAAFLWGTIAAYSQDHATCGDAIHVSSSSYGPVTPEGWADSSLCVPSNTNMYFGKSHLVVWFYFIVPYDTILTFQIIPENPSDDFDFILFKSDKGDFCQKEKQRQIQPIRSNFAKPTDYNKGITGLSTKGKDAFIAPGYNSPFSSSLQVRKGEWYYIAVDNYISDKGGFTLKIPLRFNANTNSNVSYMDAVPIKAPPIQQPASPNFYIHVLDSANHPIKASLIIDGTEHGKSIRVDTNNYSLRLGKYQTIKIRANAAGHMPYQSSYSSTGDTSTTTFWVRLGPIRSAQKITLKDIEFQEDSPNILPASKPALDYVIQFMAGNPNVKITIKGYTNDPKHTQSEKYDQNLSESRANAVKNYLSAHGIDKKRMECIGYGSSQMLYPKPINEDQQAANRRVEIEVQ